MTAEDCAKLLTETIHGNSFCALAYVIGLLGGDKDWFKDFMDKCKRNGVNIKEIYILSGNDYKDRVVIAGVLHAIESILWFKIPVSNILIEYDNLKNKKHER